MANTHQLKGKTGFTKNANVAVVVGSSNQGYDYQCLGKGLKIAKTHFLVAL